MYGSSGLCPDVAAAIREAVRDGARVINASYGFSAYGACPQHRDATSYAFGAGAVVVAASGNYRPVQPWIQPGNDLHVLTVNALNALDQPAGFSHQNLYSDVSAPGESILVAVPDWADTEDGVADGYSRWDGTSFAAPMVSAAAAWLLADDPRLSADQVAEILRRSARDLQRPGWDISTGWGTLDLKAAVRAPAAAERPLRAQRRHPLDRRAQRVPARPAAPAHVDAPDRGRARIDLQKDPVDVYPLWVPAGGRATVRLSEHGDGGRPLRVAAAVPGRPTARGAIAKSRRRGLVPDRLTVTNRGDRGEKVWIEVRGARGRALSGEYRLDMTRGRA